MAHIVDLGRVGGPKEKGSFTGLPTTTHLGSQHKNVQSSSGTNGATKTAPKVHDPGGHVATGSTTTTSGTFSGEDTVSGHAGQPKDPIHWPGGTYSGDTNVPYVKPDGTVHDYNRNDPTTWSDDDIYYYAKYYPDRIDWLRTNAGTDRVTRVFNQEGRPPIIPWPPTLTSRRDYDWDTAGGEDGGFGRLSQDLKTTVGLSQLLRGDMAALAGTSFGDLMGKLGEVQRTGGDIGGEFRAWDPLISGVQGQITGPGGLGAEVDRIVEALELMKGSFGEGGLDQLAGDTLADLETSRGLLDPETGALMAGAEGLQEALAGGALGTLMGADPFADAREGIQDLVTQLEATKVQALMDGDEDLFNLAQNRLDTLEGDFGATDLGLLLAGETPETMVSPEALTAGFDDTVLGGFLRGEVPETMVSPEALTEGFDATRLGELLSGKIPETMVPAADLTRDFDQTALGKILAGEMGEITPEVALGLGLDPKIIDALGELPTTLGMLGPQVTGLSKALRDFEPPEMRPVSLDPASIHALTGIPGAAEEITGALEGLVIPEKIDALMPEGELDRILQGITGEFDTGVGEIGTAFGEEIPGITGEFDTGLERLLETFGTGVDDIGTAFADEIPGITDEFGTGIENLGALFAEGGPLAGDITKLFDPVMGIFAEQGPVDELTKLLGPLAEQLRGIDFPGYEERLSGMLGDIYQTTGMLSPKITELSDWLRDQDWDDIKRVLGEDGEFDWDRLQSMISDAVGDGTGTGTGGTGTTRTDDIGNLATILEGMYNPDIAMDADALAADPITASLLLDFEERSKEEWNTRVAELQSMGALRSGDLEEAARQFELDKARARAEILSDAAERHRADREFALAEAAGLTGQRTTRDQMIATQMGKLYGETTMAGRENEMAILAAVTAALDPKLNIATRSSEQLGLAKALIDMLDLPAHERAKWYEWLEIGKGTRDEESEHGRSDRADDANW